MKYKIEKVYGDLEINNVEIKKIAEKILFINVDTTEIHPSTIFIFGQDGERDILEFALLNDTGTKVISTTELIFIAEEDWENDVEFAKFPKRSSIGFSGIIISRDLLK